MTCPQREWKIIEPEGDSESVAAELSVQLGMSPVIGTLLVNRGFVDIDTARRFLFPSLEGLHDPFLFKNMEKAVDLLHAAVEGGRKILVFGDYDVDGIVSISLLRLAFLSMGVDLGYYIPNRINEGYGFGIDDIEKAAGAGVGLIITVDCGIGSFEEIEKASFLGIDTIITDHHELSGPLPPAGAVLNPKDPASGYPFATLAGVGVTFKLLCGYCKRHRPDIDPFAWLDIVGLGTVADIVPLINENRILVREGLKKLSKTENQGLKGLLNEVGLSGIRINPGHISYTIAPKINAIGRISDPMMGVRFLCTDDPAEAEELARMLMECNSQRQRIEREIMRQAEEQVEVIGGPDHHDLMVLSKRGWHIGVIGIVASILKDRFHKPVILLSEDDDGARGSGRSIEGFSLHEAVGSVSETLIRFGGHDLAVGMEIRPGMVEEFISRIQSMTDGRLAGMVLEDCLLIDLLIRFRDITEELVKEIELVKPFGSANRPPVFAAIDCSIVRHRRVGHKGNHLWLVVSQSRTTFEGIGFNLGPYAETIMSPAQCFDIAFEIGTNETPRKGRYIQLKIKSMKSSDERAFAGMFSGR